MYVRQILCVIILLLVTIGCQSRDMPEKMTINQPEPPEISVEEGGQDLEYHQPMTDQSIKEVIPFKHPLMSIASSDIIPEHIQLSVGENATEDLQITLIMKEEVADLELILVDAFNEIIQYEMATTSTYEDLLAVGLHSYTFTLIQLVPNQTYLYAFRTGERYSEVYDFRLPATNQSTRVAVFGDLQGYTQEQYMAYRKMFEEAVSHGEADLHFLMGDIVDNGEDYNQWRYFFESMKGYDSQAIFGSIVGNHDVKGSRDFYNATFKYTVNGLENLPNSTGYFDLPYARVVMIDTEKPSTFVAQQQWLEETAAASDKPFTIVLMHRSVYPIFYEEPHIQVWTECLEKAGIDLVLSGHDHIYSRTEVNGVTYVVTGSGSGSKFYDQQEPREHEGHIYDDNNPVFVLMIVGVNDIHIKSFAKVEDIGQIIDEVKLYAK